jgi:hypothetical protein
MRTITAYPPTNDPLIVGLCARLTKAVNAKFYVALANPVGASGFYCQAMTLAKARKEARAHLKKYPSWESARLYHADGGRCLDRIATYHQSRAIAGTP